MDHHGLRGGLNYHRSSDGVAGATVRGGSAFRNVRHRLCGVLCPMRAVAQPRTARGLPNPAGFRGRPADPALRDIADLGLSKGERSEEHTSELQSLMRISYAVFFLQKTNYRSKVM